MDEWVRRFLTSQPAHTGVLATVRADGRPHAKPVWFALDGDDTVVLNTGEATVAGRNLARDPRAVLCVEDERPPYTFVVLEGRAALSGWDDDRDALRSWAGRIGARYLGAEKEQALAERNGVPGELLVRLRVERITGAEGVSD